MMVLGEHYDEYYGLDEYDEYDPCGEYDLCDDDDMEVEYGN